MSKTGMNLEVKRCETRGTVTKVYFNRLRLESGPTIEQFALRWSRPMPSTRGIRIDITQYENRFKR